MKGELEFKAPKSAKAVEDLTELRDLFAGFALIGMYTTAGAPCLAGLAGHEELTANAAYKQADAMLKARGQK
jgi:hypothetical protein